MNEIEQTETTPKPAKKADVGAISGSIIIILLLIIAGWYFYSELEKINADLDDVNNPKVMAPREKQMAPGSMEKEATNNPFDAIQVEATDSEGETETTTTTEAQVEVR